MTTAETEAALVAAVRAGYARGLVPGPMYRQTLPDGRRAGCAITAVYYAQHGDVAPSWNMEKDVEVRFPGVGMFVTGLEAGFCGWTGEAGDYPAFHRGYAAGAALRDEYLPG